MKQWIKLSTGVHKDRKLWKLSKEAQLVFFYLMSLAGAEDNNGVLPSFEDISLELWFLKLSEKSMRSVLCELEEAGILEETQYDEIKLKNFEKWQVTEKTKSEIDREYYLKNKKQKSENRRNLSENSAEIKRNLSENSAEIQTLDKEIEIDKEIDINTISNEIVLTPAKKAKPEKQKFGSMQNVLLTADEYAKLRERFPDADAKIESLSLAIASKGYKYKDHYATILNWARMDADKAKTSPKQEQPKKTYSFSEIVAMEDAGLL